MPPAGSSPIPEGPRNFAEEVLRRQRAEEAHQQYWDVPVWKPETMSAHGPAARPIMEDTLHDLRSRTYTQQEVDAILEEEKKKRERSEGRTMKEDRQDECLRSFPITLPVLPEPHVPHASLEAGDWLTQIRPLISDVNGAASTWWDNVVTRTMEQYHKWLGAKPMDKLKVQPPDHEGLAQGNSRLAQRVGVMLMQALPSGLRQEMVASRMMDAASILFKVFKTYQPGGLAERRQMLAQLTDTTKASTPTEAVASLRLWKRQAQRAAELHATMPDAVLQVRALTVIMEELLNKCPQASFRVSAYRMNHGIDVNPTDSDVQQFYDLLLAEAEHLVTSQGDDLRSSMDSNDSQKPLIKAMNASPAKPKGQVCKFWGSEHGCRHGRTCQYAHDWQGIQDKAERCWICSAKGHRKVECPVAKPKDDQTPIVSGGSGAGDGKQDPSGKGKGKGKRSSKGGKGKTMDKSEEPKPDKDPEGQPSVKAEKVTAEEISAPTATAAETGKEALMTEVTSLLRSIRVQGDPQIKVVSIRKLQPNGRGLYTLIDGGATHCLRMMRSEEEWNESQPVTVKLAAGEMLMRQHPRTTTLLVRDPIQAIIPVAKLVECGYSVQWDREACRIEHARHGKLKVEMDQGCPTVSAEWGERLMKEVEEMEVKKCKVRAIMQCGVLAEDLFEKQVAELHSLYPQVPLRVLERIPGERDWDPVQLPINRRKRRQLDRARGIIVNMCSGPDQRRWREMEGNGIVVLNLDLELGINVMDPHVSGWLESIIDTGKVIMWTAGPPCRTISLCRQRGKKDGGPQPVRLREGPQRFGVDDITASQQDLADHDAALWLKNLWYMRRVKRQRSDAEVMLEQPQDPREWADWAKDCPSFLVWPETQQLIADLNLSVVRINQGNMGHVTAKPLPW